jgi:DNA-binding CsgD family transcriptional regulator
VLLKAVKSLPEREQQFVLRYLIERALVPPAQPGTEEAARPPQAHILRDRLRAGLMADVPPLGTGNLEARAAGWGSLGTRTARLLVEGRTVDEIAELHQVPKGAVRSALRDVASHPETPARLSSILQFVADGRSTNDVANELGISQEGVTAELEALLPSPLAGRLGQSLQAAAALQALEPEAGSLTLGGSAVAGGRAGQQMLPVRFPEPQYRRLKEWCTSHGFSMAVVVRGLVERFLDEQERRAA